VRERRQSVADGQLVFNEDRAGLLEELRLAQVSSAFREDLGHLLRDLGQRSNAVVPSSAGQLYLKRHAAGPVPWGLVEWEGHRRLDREGIPTAEPVCAGVDRQGRSFILTVGLPGEPLDDHLRRGPLPAPRLQALTAELARLVRRLHEAGLCHRDLYLCHVFICPDRPPGQQLVLIDLQRLRAVGRVRPRRWRIKDLAALAYSSLGLPVRDRTRMRFLVAYLRPGVRRQARRRLARRIWWRTAGLLRRHGVPGAPLPREGR
jgi:heptose I phosphotransferase